MCVDGDCGEDNVRLRRELNTYRGLKPQYGCVELLPTSILESVAYILLWSDPHELLSVRYPVEASAPQ